MSILSEVKIFTRNAAGIVADVVGVDIAGIGRALVVSIAGGSLEVAGLSKLIKVTTVDIDDTAAQVLLPIPDPLTNSILIHNTSGADTLYIGDVTVTADIVLGTTSGKEILAGNEWGIDIKTGSVSVYARAPAGQTIRVKVTEFG